MYRASENTSAAFDKAAYTRGQLMHEVIAALASASVVPYARASDAFAGSAFHSQATDNMKKLAQIEKNTDIAYSKETLPCGIRSRFVENINGLTMHLQESGFEYKGRPCVLLLHGFPEWACGWRRVMLNESGICAPFVVSWPGTLLAGRTYSEPVSSLDITPTALAAAAMAKSAHHSLSRKGSALCDYVQTSAHQRR